MRVVESGVSNYGVECHAEDKGDNETKSNQLYERSLLHLHVVESGDSGPGSLPGIDSLSNFQ